MARNINDSGLVFTASSLKTLLFGTLTTAICAFCVYKLWQMNAPLEPLHGSRAMRAFIGVAAITSVISLMNLVILIFEKAVSFRIDQQKMTYRFLFAKKEWQWEDIDRLHLEAPEPPSSLYTPHALGILIASKILPLGKTSFRFQDLAYEERRNRRLFFRPKQDGFVAIPLGYFDNPEEIYEAADRQHVSWYMQKNRENDYTTKQENQ